MIIREVPVKEECRPDFMSVYWALPWIDTDKIRKAFSQYLRINISTYYNRSFKKEIEAIPDEVFQNIHDESRYPPDYKDELKRFAGADTIMSPVGYGVDPNPASAMRVIINHEAVKIWPHEYNIIDSDKLKKFIREKSHSLVPGNVAEEKIVDFVLDEVTKFIYDAAIIDGCTEEEAKMMCIGIDVSERYEVPPIGWYKIKEDYQKMFVR